MLKKLVLDGSKSEQDIEDFLFKISPFTDKNTKFRNFLGTLKLQRSYIEQMGETDNTSGELRQKFFLAWYGWNMKVLYAGTVFVPQREFTKGISLSDYENQVQ